MLVEQLEEVHPDHVRHDRLGAAGRIAAEGGDVAADQCSGTGAAGSARGGSGRPSPSRRSRRRSPRCHAPCAPGRSRRRRCRAPRPRGARRTPRRRARRAPASPSQPRRIEGRRTRLRWCTAAGMMAEIAEGWGSAANGRVATIRSSSTSTSKAPQWLDVTRVFRPDPSAIAASRPCPRSSLARKPKPALRERTVQPPAGRSRITAANPPSDCARSAVNSGQPSVRRTNLDQSSSAPDASLRQERSNV